MWLTTSKVRIVSPFHLTSNECVWRSMKGWVHVTSSYLTAPCIGSLLRLAWLFHDNFSHMIHMGASASGDKRENFWETFPPIGDQCLIIYMTTKKAFKWVQGHQWLFWGSSILRHTMTHPCFVPSYFSFNSSISPWEGHSGGLPLCHGPGATLCSAARNEGEDRTFHVKFGQGRVFGQWFVAIGSS